MVRSSLYAGMMIDRVLTTVEGFAAKVGKTDGCAPRPVVDTAVEPRSAGHPNEACIILRRAHVSAANDLCSG